MRWRFPFVHLMLLSVACSAGPPSEDCRHASITYDLKRINRIASNQVAIWIEDLDGKYVKTVHAYRFMARGG